ncbi:hypothetical protein [Roseomonas sp. BN140053]|uniref:hypothetical protein n=1 Tax=Roseomonas sp. BN140053 TaxID=3391898 RepID=UPI0039EA99F6
MRLSLAFLLLCGLAACGDLPQPYRGRPGGLARQLVQPPAYRIAVPAPDAALLPDQGSTALAVAIAEALEAAEVPAVAGPPTPLDWHLTITAEREGRNVVPAYALSDADNRPLAQARGTPVPVERWAMATEATLRDTAGRDAPAIAAMLGRVDVAQRSADPAALAAGTPPRIRLVPVRGAPGDGNRALAARMTDFLGTKGLVVQDQAAGAAFAVQGDVTMAPGAAGKQRVEIQWIVTRRDGFELGRALQLNEIAPGSLNGLWGDVAYVVAEEASGAVRDIIANAGGFAAAPPGATPAAAAAPPATGSAPPAPGAVPGGRPAGR